MSLKFLQLNIETNKHFDKIIPFLEKENFDVLLLEEVFENDAKMLAERFGMHLCLGKYLFRKGDRKVILSKYPFSKTEDIFIWGKDSRYHFPTEDFSLLKAQIIYDGKQYNLCNTHLPVSYPGNIIVDYQKDCYHILKEILIEEKNVLFTGDLNAPRGTYIFDDIATYMTDNIPKEIDSTIDPGLHRNRDLNIRYVVDAVFSAGNHVVRDVLVHEGLSDHKGISGFLEIN